MAANPDLIKAVDSSVSSLLPWIVLFGIISILAELLRKPSRRRSRQEKPILESILDGVFNLIAWPFRLVEKNRMFNAQRTLEQLRQLSPIQFEEYIERLFSRLGYSTEHVGGSYDGGIDVIAKRDSKIHYIQCKKFISSQVSVHDVRDFYGAITGLHANADAFFITTHEFTPDAIRFCQDKPILLIDGQTLMEYVRKASGFSKDLPEAERCPLDGGTLVQRNGKYGQFIGCSNFPKCKFTKSL